VVGFADHQHPKPLLCESCENVGNLSSQAGFYPKRRFHGDPTKRNPKNQ
jgi:hypothetical protein